jgi:transcriptional regulator with XRE-family HTH domain
MLYFGEKIRALRLERGLTQKQLADKIGLGKGSISAYEQSAKYPSIEVLINLCKYFNVSADYLIGLSDSMEYSVSALTDAQLSIIMQLISNFEQHNKLKKR